MSEDFDLFGLPRGKGEPRKAGPGVSPGSRPLGRPPRYGHGSFLTRINRSVAKAHAAKGTNRYSRSKPKTGRFNARGRGRKAYAGGIGPAKGWQVRGGVRYRARRVIVKARVTKLRGSGSRATYAHLKYLQRDGADVERKMEDGKLIEHERSGQLYDAAFDPDVQEALAEGGFLIAVPAI